MTRVAVNGARTSARLRRPARWTEAGSGGAPGRACMALEERPEEADVLVTDGAADVGDAARPCLQQVAGGVDAHPVQVPEVRLARRRREPPREVARAHADASGQRGQAHLLLEIAEQPVLRFLDVLVVVGRPWRRRAVAGLP